MRQRTCKRCNQPCEAGVHFDIREVLAGVVRRLPAMTYDICGPCFDTYSPLILPAAAAYKKATSYDVQYEAFGGFMPKNRKEMRQA